MVACNQATHRFQKAMRNRLLVTVVEAGKILERAGFEVSFRRNLNRITVVFRGEPSPFGKSGSSRKDRIFIDPSVSAYEFSIAFTHVFALKKGYHTSQIHYAWVFRDPEHLPEGWYDHA